MTYRVKFPTESIKDKFSGALKKISDKKLQEAIMYKTTDLADNPRPYISRKLTAPARVYTYTAHYRIRIGDYRVLYDIDDKNKIVWVYILRKRSENTYK